MEIESPISSTRGKEGSSFTSAKAGLGLGLALVWPHASPTLPGPAVVVNQASVTMNRPTVAALISCLLKGSPRGLLTCLLSIAWRRIVYRLLDQAKGTARFVGV